MQEQRVGQRRPAGAQPDGQTADGVGILTISGGPPVIAVVLTGPEAGYVGCGSTGVEGLVLLALLAWAGRKRLRPGATR